MNSSEKARHLITNNWLLTLATADKNGKPWISPVGYIYDEQFNLYWVSNKEALHSENIRNRPQVAIVIIGKLPDGKTDGVYYDTEAEELNDETEISFVIKLLQKRKQEEKFKVNSLSDVAGEAVWRIYKAKVNKVSKRGDRILKGQAITIREPIDLNKTGLYAEQTIKINAPAQKVWDVLTNEEFTTQWVNKFQSIFGALRSHWQQGSPVEWQTPEGKTLVNGRVTACMPCQYLSYTVHDVSGEFDDVQSDDDGIVYTLTETNNETLLVVRQGDFSKIGDKGQEFCDSTTESWSRVLPIIKQLSEAVS